MAREKTGKNNGAKTRQNDVRIFVIAGPPYVLDIQWTYTPYNGNEATAASTGENLSTYKDQDGDPRIVDPPPPPVFKGRRVGFKNR